MIARVRQVDACGLASRLDGCGDHGRLALVTSPSRWYWNAASVAVIVVNPTFVCVERLSVALIGVGSAKE